ncbi:class I adenylate-forming enzyme family protein [Bacillus pseudomycoides]|uniref:class I adenylate-forming enzyme family protein n=1 Tax=Bacillus pseudomycoides TaxID=64104 RepID=UPI001FB1E040|nr:AMP-binding protein [Bacillus pseudomycoides]
MNYDLSLPEILKRSSQEFLEKEALYDGYNRITYGELKNNVEYIASALSQLGIKKGDRVIVCLPNWNEFVTIYFAVARLGAVLIPCNTRYRITELEYIVENSQAKAVFLMEDFQHIDVFKPYLNRTKKSHTLECIFTVRFQQEGYYSFNELMQLGQQTPAPKVVIDPKEDVFAILYTSGTTGRPKGTMLTHENVAYTAKRSAEWLRCSSGDVFLIAVPVFHIFGMVPGILSAISSAAKIVFMEKYNAEKALKIIELEKITIHHGVPTMFILELNHPTFTNVDLTSLRTGIIASAPCPEEIVKKIRSVMGCDIVVSYGLTETSAGLTFTSFDDDDSIRSETVGKAAPGTEIKIVDAKREEVAPGEVGELACRGLGIMKGYYQMPDQTREAIDKDGWFYTGDLATKDEKGFIRIVGRKKEMIIRGGYNIYPREIEEVFYKHSSVLEVAIIGLPDSVLGEISCAVIKLKPNYVEDEGSMKAYVKDKIANYKIPDRIVFMEELPMTASGKIKKLVLQDVIKEKLYPSLQ